MAEGIQLCLWRCPDFVGLKHRAELQTGARSCSELVVNESSVPISLWDWRDATCWDCTAAQHLSSPSRREAPVITSLLSLSFPEINNGVEPTDELSFCSENGYANEMVTPMDPRAAKLRLS